jgi:prepilin-type N-terminal cleavage/methylation domain-containing protein
MFAIIKDMNRYHRGFTVIELIIVIVVIALLATLGSLAWRTARDDAVERKQQTDVVRLQDAIEKYAQDNGEYPFPDTTPPCETVDPFTGNLERVCLNGELSTVLVPKYISEIPKDKDGQEFQYVAEREYHGPPIPNALYRAHRYGIKVPDKTSPYGYCIAGSKKIKETWWHSGPNNLSRCSF